MLTLNVHSTVCQVLGGGGGDCSITTNTEQQPLMHTPYAVGLPGYMFSACVGYPPFSHPFLSSVV